MSQSVIKEPGTGEKGKTLVFVRPARSMRYGIEWPTWLLIGFIHAAWFGLIAGSDQWAWPVRYGLMSVLLAWHSSMVHELIYGHPTRIQAVNDVLAFLPLSLVPYFDYKATHIKHHIDVDLTRPEVDPESFLLHPKRYQTMGGVRRWLALTNMTLLGRLIFLVPRSYMGIGRRALAAWKKGSLPERGYWLIDFLALLVVLIWIGVSDFPILLYLAAAVTGAMMIGLRAFYEHRPHPQLAARSVVVETVRPLAWLFLHNNLHAVHHKYPGMAWYLLPAAYRLSRGAILDANHGYFYRGYSAWLRYAVRPVMSPLAPGYVLDAAPSSSRSSSRSSAF